jgi:hypothetical protein
MDYILRDPRLSKFYQYFIIAVASSVWRTKNPILFLICPPSTISMMYYWLQHLRLILCHGATLRKLNRNTGKQHLLLVSSTKQ